MVIIIFINIYSMSWIFYLGFFPSLVRIDHALNCATWCKIKSIHIWYYHDSELIHSMLSLSLIHMHIILGHKLRIDWGKIMKEVKEGKEELEKEEVEEKEEGEEEEQVEGKRKSK